eukprot:scaffold6754_cov229-Prasinococcus_capsulatus_cf.AAC.1
MPAWRGVPRRAAARDHAVGGGEPTTAAARCCAARRPPRRRPPSPGSHVSSRVFPGSARLPWFPCTAGSLPRHGCGRRPAR